MSTFQRVEASSSRVAFGRLLHDQRLRPIAEQRAALSILAHRLEAACRDQLLRSLPALARTDKRLLPAVRELTRQAWNH